MLPLVGTGKSAWQLGTGKDAVTGEDSSGWANGIGLAAGLIPFGKFGVRIAGDVAEGFADLAKFRSELGLVQGQGTLARLEINGSVFYGINAHGQPISMSVNAISMTHAEADAFQQALNAGTRGGSATLHVDRALCAACGQNGGVRSMARQLGLDQVTVHTPQGTQVIRP